jgi:glutaredoxin 3
MAPSIVVYTTQWCGYCESARRILRAHGLAFEDVDLTRDPALRQRMIAETGHPTVPIILIDGELVGGCNELAELARTGGLDALARMTPL